VNAVDKGRNSAAVYADLEYDVTENGCLTVPCYENYSDFGELQIIN
jgi:iron complex outermembrane receptor protein